MSVQISEIKTGVKRFLATCTEHPTWRPGSHYDTVSAQWDKESHLASWYHDGIDYGSMPATLSDALLEISDRGLRRRVARAAQHWKEAN